MAFIPDYLGAEDAYFMIALMLGSRKNVYLGDGNSYVKEIIELYKENIEIEEQMRKNFSVKVNIKHSSKSNG